MEKTKIEIIIVSRPDARINVCASVNGKILFDNPYDELTSYPPYGTLQAFDECHDCEITINGEKVPAGKVATEAVKIFKIK